MRTQPRDVTNLPGYGGLSDCEHVEPPLLFAAFDRVVVINLPERTDRRRQMRRELRRAGGHGEFFPAIRPRHSGIFATPGTFGSFLSHAAVIRDVARDGQSVLILEDDCNFFSGASGYRVPPCDVFYGSHAEDADEIIGAHCIGFSRHAVRLLDSYLEDYLTPAFESDPKAAALPGYDPRIRPPIDGAYVWFRRRFPELSTHFALLTYQRPSRSDCTPARLVDRIPVARDLVEMARRLSGRKPALGSS